MLLRNVSITGWCRKVFYALLIFCVGGVGPLTYFDAFLPDHPHPFHLSFLAHSDHHHHESDHCPSDHHLSPRTPTQPAQAWQIERLSPFSQPLFKLAVSTGYDLTSGFVNFFSSGLSLGYLLTVAEFGVISSLPLISQVSPTAPAGRSTWRPPPEKPPPSLFFS